MFTKKSKKIEIKTEGPKESKVEVRVAPLVRIEEQEIVIDGKVKNTTHRIAIGGRDVISLTTREFKELTLEILRGMDASEQIHFLYLAHKEKHDRQDKIAHHGAEAMKGLMEALGMVVDKEN
jgi:hypothetical protein